MIMRTLLSMETMSTYAFNKDIKSLRLHVATCFEETASLFNVHLSFFVDLILCPTEKYMSKVNNKKIILIC